LRENGREKKAKKKKTGDNAHPGRASRGATFCPGRKNVSRAAIKPFDSITAARTAVFFFFRKRNQAHLPAAVHVDGFRADGSIGFYRPNARSQSE